MSDYTPLTDEGLLHIVGAPAFYGKDVRTAAAELIERRAADAPFAVGDKVSWANTVGDYEIVGMDIVRLKRTDFDCPIVSAWIGDLTPVPPSPTAVEVFAEILRNAGIVNPRGLARRVCEAASINPDLPLPAKEVE